MSASNLLPPLTPSETASAPKEKDLPPGKAAEACLATAEIMEKNGHDQQALFQYELARKYDARLNSRVCRRLALIYDRIGDSQRALVEYKQCLQLHPKDPDLLNDIGYCHYQHGEWLEAEKWFRQALDVAPKHARATVNLGMTLGQKGEYPEALEMFKRVNSPGEAHVNMGFIYQTHAKRDEAKQAYKTAIELQPDLDLARRALAKLEAPPKVSENGIEVAERVNPFTKPEVTTPRKPEPLAPEVGKRTDLTSRVQPPADPYVKPTRAETGPPDLKDAVRNQQERDADLARLEEFVQKRNQEVRNGPPPTEPPMFLDPVKEKLADAAPAGIEAPKGMKTLRTTKPITISIPSSGNSKPTPPAAPSAPVAISFD
jgi:Tfp pilus assembly protein PilF